MKRLTRAEVAELVASKCRVEDYRGQSVLLIIPDSTRTAPVGLLFKELHRQIGSATRRLDVLVALGTHPPMSETEICARLELSSEERTQTYRKVAFHNHAWDDPAALELVGTLQAEEVAKLSGGLFSLEVPVRINRLLFQYDQVIILGPVFPHEVVGFSGGNKYLFPGVSGPEILNFFHWLGAVVTNPRIIGHKWTPVRRVVDHAASLVKVDKRCFAMVVAPGHPERAGGNGGGAELAGLFWGTPEHAWEMASDLSSRVHITRKPRPFHTILSCAPSMYDELWTAGKCMYKLEPVLADGGQLIIYAPQLKEISSTHGHYLRQVGYHCRDYFLNQWDQFKHLPWGVLAHSAHVRGLGTFAHGVERFRAEVTLATAVPADVCRQINLGYQDHARIQLPDFVEREAEGVLVVPRAGEMLFQLEQPPSWAVP